NDDLRFNPNGSSDPLWIGGGSIDLSVTAGSLLLGEGSLLDVTAGARRRADGTIDAGKGGRISLTANTTSAGGPAQLSLGAELRGYALRDGGSVSITAPSICITSGACGFDAALTLDPEFFASGGFGSISLTTDLGDLRLEQGTVLNLRQHNFELLAASA